VSPVAERSKESVTWCSYNSQPGFEPWLGKEVQARK
jgi:hypothetical protein